MILLMNYSGAIRRAARGSCEGMLMQSDEQIMSAIAAGDQQAYATAVRLHSRAIAAYAFRMLGNEAETQDVAQETFLRLWLHAARWDGRKASLSTWLHRIAHNLCIDALRRQRTESLADADAVEAPETASAAQLLDQAAAVQVLREGLSSLPERQRSALLLSHYQGLSNRDIADILSISVDATESLLARARRTLKSSLRSNRAITDRVGD
jgi:RNA polymerase sigma-70 factor, ECF subfamily